jgi:hypothetical protein
MADGSVPEHMTSEVKHEVLEAAEHAAESALESVDVEKMKEEVSKEGQHTILEIQDFAKIAEDPEDPSLMEEISQKSATVQAEIHAAIEAAKTEVERVVRGEAPASPEAQIAELKKSNVTEATGETETVAKTENAEAPLNDLVKRLQDIATEFKSSNSSASKLLQKKLLKLVGDTSPEKYPNDVRVTELRSMMARLKMAFDGDANSWQSPGGGSYEEDLALFQKSLSGSEGEKSTEPKLEKTVIDPQALEGGSQTVTQIMPQKTQIAEAPPAEAMEPVEPEQPMVNLEEFNQKADQRFQTGDDTGLAMAIGDIESGTAQNVAILQKKIETLEKMPAEKRSASHDRELERLQIEVRILEKNVEWRREQLRLIKARHELVSTTADIENVTKELEQLKAPSKDAKLTTPDAAEDPKILLQQKLEELIDTRIMLVKKIAGLEASVKGLASEIEKLSSLLKRAQGEEKRAESTEEKKEKAPKAIPSSPDEHEGRDTLPGAQAPSKGGFSFESDVINRTGDYIHDPGKMALDILDVVSMHKTKSEIKKDE